ncbi:uncharacterized protein ATNIH1004_008461 [Aspergillus tanneri]|uniref:Uncharacterized protein n=1 Tax=Aspergillus tanneri TaxID=1220188 RepID=A0A5M9MB34_9EURO|nr:uncharacterized protein ATNIH1004_008461 [Aspergillus tanneri]KAA8644262.1 hypothetical protein ATNIH1004_008461 [Aspergillus tanneri]
MSRVGRRDISACSPVLTVPLAQEPRAVSQPAPSGTSLVSGHSSEGLLTPAPILSAVPKWGFIGPLLRLQVAVARGTTAAEGLSIGRNPTLEFLGGETAACLLNISQPPIEIPFLIVRITKRSGPTMGWSCTPW